MRRCRSWTAGRRVGAATAATTRLPRCGARPHYSLGARRRRVRASPGRCPRVCRRRRARRTMASYALDVELFISEVKKFPQLWDLNSEDYRYKTRKQQAWAGIARVFINDFDDMPDSEKLDVYRKLHGKWRNIRDSYVRHVKKKYGKRGYMHAKHLTFLDNMYKHTSNSGSDIDADHNDDTWPSDTEDSKLDKIFLKKPQDIKNDNWLSDAEEAPLENLKRKRKGRPNDIEYVDTSYPEAACSYSVAEDDDRSFFESLLPAVRSFDLDQKLEFRSEVIKLIKNIRNNSGKYKLDPRTGEYDQ